MVLRAQEVPEKVQEALHVLSKACETYPKNSQLRFQRAHALIYVEAWEEAYEELQLVMELAPREAPVYTLLGNICQKLGRNALALGYFNTAMSLDPKEAAALRSNLENLDPDPDMDEDEDDDEEEEEEEMHSQDDDQSSVVDQHSLLSMGSEGEDDDDDAFVDASSFQSGGSM
jgi:tetratricopeptide (TPR) repeat protein